MKNAADWVGQYRDSCDRAFENACLASMALSNMACRAAKLPPFSQTATKLADNKRSAWIAGMFDKGFFLSRQV